ncbi:hypothetical protein QBC37DRAFT_436392 [Rhypophila decipiens]|uniref:Tetratricopeptide SHNi-TPR domain-containing protein n=1 Tax=Rhypophila decipiens TaxID=261697 RepID=A0AAN7BD51_9PEZI|nr:hypothetical protein QBC37DRAFT_436392 [Rhypophila decipiens]
MATSVPTSGTATPMELDPEQIAMSLKVSLADMSAKAAALFARKNYEEATEVYAQAAEMQAEMNGEMSPENAEILFLYGRALFKVGQSKSDVLGGKAPDTKKPKAKPASSKAKATNGSAQEKKPEAENGGSSSAALKEAEAKVEQVVSQVVAAEAEKKDDAPKKPLFQFEGDENFDESDEEEEAGEGEGEEEEEDDDLAVSFEILDLARVLFNKKLEALLAEPQEPEKPEEEGNGKEPASGDSPAIRHVKERLADTHDLLAEIELENERYPNAITDSRASLKYKQDLYPEESEIVAEAHFKLSLALEFASITKSSDDANESGSATADQVDQALRDEAATELEAAINSTKLKLQNKEVELATLHSPEDNDLTREQITEVKEVIADMEQRLVELRKPPVDLKAALGLPPKEQTEKIETEVPAEVKKNAHDLSGLVKKKRKAEDVVDASEKSVEAKKVKEDDGTPEVPAVEA